jgi:hypothetical protein
MPVTRGAFDQLLVPGANKVYVDEYNELPSMYDQIFDIDTSGRAFEDDLVATGIGIAVSKPEGEEIAFDRPKFRGRVRYIHTTFGLGYEITREAVEDELYGVLNSQGAANLARSMREVEEISAASVLNGAFTTTMAYDGVPLISTSHPNVFGDVFANRPATDEDLSISALKSASERFWALETDRGLKISLAPEMLLVAPQGWWNAQEILGAPYFSAGAQGQYTPNVSGQMGLKPTMWRYLTDPDAWFLLAPKAQHTLKFFWRRKPDPTSGYDGRAEVAWYGITARLSAGVTDWRGIDGSPGY